MSRSACLRFYLLEKGVGRKLPTDKRVVLLIKGSFSPKNRCFPAKRLRPLKISACIGYHGYLATAS